MPGLYSPSAGDVLTAANAISYWSKQVVIQCTSGTRPTAVEGMTIYETDNDCLCVYDGTAWVQITSEAATVATSETETNTSYDDMATSGPAVTITTSTKVLTTLGAQISNTSNSYQSWMSWACSGATTVAAADTWAVKVQKGTGALSDALSFTAVYASLTAGANTFTSKYKVSGSTGTYVYRNISAVGLLG